MIRLHEDPFAHVGLQWFAAEEADEEEENEKSGEGEEDADQQELDEINELDISDMEPEEAQAFVKNLVTRNKQLSKKSRKRLHEIMEKKNKIKELQKKDEDEKRKDLEEKEEYKKLYEEAKPKLDILEKDTAKTQEFFERELERQTDLLPEKYHKLIPDIDIRERIRWIEDFRNEIGEGTSGKSKGGEELDGKKAAQKAKAEEEDVDEEDEEEETPPVKKKKKSMNTKTAPTGDEQEGGDEASGAIEQQIANCTNAAELEDLLRKYGRRE